MTKDESGDSGDNPEASTDRPSFEGQVITNSKDENNPSNGDE